MTLRPLPSVEALARGLGRSTRAALRRAVLMATAGVIGLAGCGFVVFACFAALRLLVGPELAALGIGIALLALAALLAGQGPRPVAETPPGATLPPDAPLPSADPATLAVFTAAFVLGRRLADRWRG